MTTISRPNGLIVELPDGFTVEPAPAAPSPGAASGRRRYTAFAAPRGTAYRTADVIDALTRQGLVFVDELPIAPERRRGRAAQPAGSLSIAVSVPVNDDEDSIILLEQEGFYSWHFPAEAAGVRGAGRLRSAMVGAGETVRFELPLNAAPVPPEPGGRRSLLSDFVLGRLRAVVFKFVAERAVDLAMAQLERGVSTGLVVMQGADPQAWKRARNLTDLPLPTDRPARVLLFLHGTFSSTAGSFGLIGAYPWGSALLDAARDSYDALIGYDHATLSVDPQENAKDLLARLRLPEGISPPHIDVVAFSRGGLVFRSLAEQLLVKETVKPEIGRVVFVAVPNCGTNLAEPDNWHAFADLYTNLVAGACQLVGMIVPANTMTTILEEAVKGLAAFVKYATTHAVAEGGVPGLAAMRPKGAFITEINRTKINKTAAGQAVTPLPYCAISSEFQARILDGDHEPRELPRRLVLALIDRFGDRLLGGPNDLVIDTASMCGTDPQACDPFKDRFDFGITPYVYHTTYFTRPEVTQALGRWLGLGDDFGIGRATTVPPPAVRRGEYHLPVAPAPVVADLPASALMADLMAMMAEEAPDYIVIDRIDGGKVRRYAISRAEALAVASDKSPNEELIDAFDLHETGASPTATPWGAEAVAPTIGERPERSRLVVVDGRRVTDVKTAEPEPLSNMTLLRWAGRGQSDSATATLTPELAPAPPPALAAMTGRPPGPRRGYLTTDAAEAPVSRPAQASGRKLVANVEDAPPPAPPQTVTIHALAECAKAMKLNSAETVWITLSREEIAARTGTATDDTRAPVNPAKLIDIELWPRQGFALSDKRRQQVQVPEPGKPEKLSFEVMPETQGEGELWFLLRQEENLIAVMELHVRIVASASESNLTETTSLRVETGGIVPRFQQLQVFERMDGNGQTIHHYVLDLPGLAFQEFESSPIKDRELYINTLYADIENRWINSNSDIENFKSELEEFGADLFQRLFPDTLQRVLWQNRNQIRDIRVVANEPFIPWELVLLKEPGGVITNESFFLAERGLTRWLLGKPSVDRLRLRRGRLRCLAPRYAAPLNKLPWAEKEAEHLQREYGAVSVPPTSEEVRRLLGQPDGFDGLHVASHGLADAGQIQSARILLQERLVNGKLMPEHLSPVTVESRGQLDEPEGRRPLVVVNACQLGRSGFQLTAMGGFAQAFLASGAGAFVGTLWSVDDEAAFLFTEAFYKALHEKCTLAEAATLGREAARQIGDASWLAYSVYGDPRATVET